MAGACTAPARAGAWTQNPGEGVLIVTSLLDRAETAFGPDGDRVEDGYFHKDETAAYLEYGVDARHTLVARLAWQSVRRLNGPVHDSATGLSASEIGVRRSLWRDDRQIVSAQLLALIPGVGENVTNQPLGDGDGAWEARLLWGRTLAQDQFIDVQMAHRWRGGVYLDEARLDVSWGWRPVPQWLVLAQGFSVWSADPARPGAPDFEQHKVQVSVGRAFGPAEYHAGIVLTPAGRNTIDERGVFLSVWRRF